MSRRGVALLAVLWTVAAIGAAAALGLTAVREGVGSAAYRIAVTRARWSAMGCLAERRSALDEKLHERDASAWLSPAQAEPDAACLMRFEVPRDSTQLAEPAVWDVTATVRTGGYQLQSVTERWVRAGDRVAVIRRIVW